MTRKTTRTKVFKKSKSNFQIKNEAKLCDSKARTQKLKQGHEMCKTNVKTNLYFANICKHKHGKNMSRLWYKILFKISAKQIERNERSYFYLYSFGELTQGSFQGSFYVCIK
jgi:hypothetical protein